MVRKPIEEWSDATQWKCKLTILIKPDFDSFDDVKDSLKDIDAFICCLGTRTKTGEANFVKVDYQYPLNFAEFAKANNVKHYSLLTSGGADANSSFLYMRVKGQVEEAVAKVGVPSLAIYNPGLIKGRKGNDTRVGETVLGWIPFIPSIQSADLGLAILTNAIATSQREQASSDEPSKVSYTMN